MNYLDVDRTYGQTSENYAISLGLTSPASNQKGPKTVNANIGKRGLVWSDPVLRQVCHLLLSNGCLSFSAAETVTEGPFHCSSSPHDPESFSDHGEYMFRTRVPGSVMVEPDYQMDNMV